MALYVGTTHKQLLATPDEQWTNVYTISSSNIVTALSDLDAIAVKEAEVMGETARVFKTHVIAKVGGTGYQHDVDMVGLQPVADPDTLLPMWNTVLCRFTSDQGRPEIKYLKLPLYIDMIDGVNIKNSVQTSVQLGFVQDLVGMAAYTGPNGETHTGGFCSDVIQMRQVDWHRRQRPGFKRGWVPV